MAKTKKELIHHALQFLTDEVNTYLNLINGSTEAEGKLILTNVATQEGNWAIPPNRLGLSLINIEEEKVFKEQRSSFVNAQGMAQHYNPEIKINLYILFTANYTSSLAESDGVEYLEGLKQLSYVLSFFQGKNVFTPDNSPALEDTGLSKLVVELFSYNFEQLYNFWTVLGAKYLPSVLYKARLIHFQDERVIEQQKALRDLDLTNLAK